MGTKTSNHVQATNVIGDKYFQLQTAKSCDRRKTYTIIYNKQLWLGVNTFNVYIKNGEQVLSVVFFAIVIDHWHFDHKQYEIKTVATWEPDTALVILVQM